MNWIPITPETVIPKGTQLLALRKRGPWSTDTVARWHQTIDAVIVDRVGDVCGNQHPNADELRWYGHKYDSAGTAKSYSHYIPLADLPGLPPLPGPTEEDIARRKDWEERSAAGAKRMAEVMRSIYPDSLVAKLVKP